MEDQKIVKLLWQRAENAIEALAKKYGVENTAIKDFSDQK